MSDLVWTKRQEQVINQPVNVCVKIIFQNRYYLSLPTDPYFGDVTENRHILFRPYLQKQCGIQKCLYTVNAF